MSNMSYCRFTNTLNDLRDCNENLFEPVSPSEAKARLALVKLCIEIANSLELEELEEDVKDAEEA